jgi:hypothetical protein
MNDDSLEDLAKEDLEAPLIGEDDDLLPPPPIPGPAKDDLNDDLGRGELPHIESAQGLPEVENENPVGDNALINYDPDDMGRKG